MTTSTLERPTTQVKQAPPKETTDLRIPAEWLQTAPAPAPAKPEPAQRRWPTYVMIGLVAALIGLVLGVAAATLYKEHQINDLKSQLATQVTISQIAPGNGQLPWRPPVGRTGYSLGRQVAPTALLTRPAPVVFTRTLGRQVAPVSLLTRAAPPPPLVTPRTTLGRQVAPTSLLTRPAPVFFERTLGRQLAPLSLLTR